MNYRTIAKRPETYAQTLNERTHVNRITLSAAPWEIPEEEKQHPRPIDPPQFKVSSPPVSVNIDKPKAVDRFSAWQQSELAERMLATARAEGHRGEIPKSIAAQKESGAKGAATRREYSSLMIRLLSHLQHGDVTRSALRVILGNSGNFNTQRRRAEELGWVKGEDGSNDRMWITSAGLVALAEMKANGGGGNGRFATGGSRQ